MAKDDAVTNDDAHDDARPGFSRRGALLAAGAATAGALGATVATRLGAGGAETTGPGGPAAPGGPTPPVPAAGAHQAGIARPLAPQQHTLLAVCDLDSSTTAAPDALRDALARATGAITSVTAADPEPDGAGDLTVTIGLGPAVVAALDSTLPGAAPLPAFRGDEAIAPERNGGDLFVSVCASNPAALSPALAVVLAAVGGTTVRWQQLGFRAPGRGTVARNPLGFHDGVIVPRGEEELTENVWIPDGPAAGGTVCVVRQLRLDVARFSAEPVAEQEATIGRRKSDGAPLSGGGPGDDVDLRAKSPDGELITPLRSHARAAHPSFTGSHLMLRRGYAYANGPATDAAGARVDDQGLLFVCFQRELDDFVRTQQRLDEADDLMDYATPVASASFLVLPGFSAGGALGATLPG